LPRVLNKHVDALPNDAIYVGRPTRYGNPFIIGRDGSRAEVIERYAATLHDRLRPDEIEALRGHDLVCWCAPQPCHADVLLHLANQPKKCES
jgi:prephenate dehydrogenase